LIAKSRPEPDDGPEPYRTTPRRLSKQIRERASELADLAIRIRELAAQVPEGKLDVAVNELLALTALLSEQSIAVLVGKVEILDGLVDDKHRPERPILDAIEIAPLNRIADDVAPAIAARGDTGPSWADDNGASWAAPSNGSVRPPPEHPAAGPARAAAKRRKGQGKPVDPEAWKDAAKHDELANRVKAALAPLGARKNGRKGGAS
jgi:hypothetical protein